MKNTTEGQIFTDIVLDIFKLNGLLVVEGDRLTKEVGLTSARWKVLGALAMSAEPMTVAGIARKMGQTRQGVQRIADEMAGEGIVNFQDNPQHKRAKNIIITAKGKKMFGALEKIQTPWADKSVGDIKLTELKTTLEVLRKLIQRFEP